MYRVSLYVQGLPVFDSFEVDVEDSLVHALALGLELFGSIKQVLAEEGLDSIMNLLLWGRGQGSSTLGSRTTSDDLSEVGVVGGLFLLSI